MTSSALAPAACAPPRRDQPVGCHGWTVRISEATLGLFDVATIYLGERLGLYRALHGSGPLTARELAAATGTRAGCASTCAYAGQGFGHQRRRNAPTEAECRPGRRHADAPPVAVAPARPTPSGRAIDPATSRDSWIPMCVFSRRRDIDQPASTVWGYLVALEQGPPWERDASEVRQLTPATSRSARRLHPLVSWSLEAGPPAGVSSPCAPGPPVGLGVTTVPSCVAATEPIVAVRRPPEI